jgi:hydroxyquinol 1,2-dioxygenase
VTTPGLSVSQRRSANEITHEVIASFSKCSDARLRELLQSLVTHLHAFAREVRLTPQEWARAMEVLAETGRLTDENRQEFILWSDTFGLSTAVDALDDRRDPRATESTVEGPFRAYGSPRREYGESIAEQPGGVPLWLHGRVLDVHGTPIAAAELDVWQNGPDRLYSVQDPHAPQGHLRGIFRTRQDGTYALLGIRPSRTRFRRTARWAPCFAPPAGSHGARRTSISPSPLPDLSRSSPTSSTTSRSSLTPMPSSQSSRP